MTSIFYFSARQELKDKSVFADAFNFFVYGGEQVIKPEMLRPMDAAELGMFENTSGEDVPRIKNFEFVHRFRDNLNLCAMMQDENTAYMIPEIDEQSEVHYAMPVKTMGYEKLYDYIYSHLQDLEEMTKMTDGPMLLEIEVVMDMRANSPKRMKGSAD